MLIWLLILIYQLINLEHQKIFTITELGEQVGLIDQVL
ncbi:hypothetical protein HERIO_2745 [Hepatospora eriocheir]|uniref:Uncharacterized protein n=1 Tax=Hepatospora eriocheir TaxID=1081669 RepID=A0A1X0Q5Z0_9MICR|nr:hypothetical protein HERIO_2745 [Hepatospora eriocheir]